MHIHPKIPCLFLSALVLVAALFSGACAAGSGSGDAPRVEVKGQWDVSAGAVKQPR